MVLIAGIGVLTRRGPATGNALAVVAAALALARPELTADVGFQLTVSATAGLVFLAPRLDAAWEGAGGTEAAGHGGRDGGRAIRLARAAGRWLRRGAAATAGAQLLSLPLALPVFHLGSWAAPVLNLFAIPYTAFALAACLGWTALASASPGAAGAALPLLDRVAVPFGWPAIGPPGAWGAAASVAPPIACWALAALARVRLLARLPLVRRGGEAAGGGPGSRLADPPRRRPGGRDPAPERRPLAPGRRRRLAPRRLRRPGAAAGAPRRATAGSRCSIRTGRRPPTAPAPRGIPTASRWSSAQRRTAAAFS
jgi:predicted membrane metal-binding protein